MDSPRRQRGLVVLSLFREEMPGWERWVDAVIGALDAASADAEIAGPWRVLVGVDDESAALSHARVRAAVRAAAAVGGDLLVLPLAGGGDPLVALAAHAGDASLALLLDTDTLLLPTTLARLLHAHELAGSPVAARTLPLDGRRGISEPTGTGGSPCVLTGLGDIAAARSSARDVPEAVAVRCGAWPAPESASAPAGSLLEDAVLAGTASEEAVGTVAQALGARGDTLLSIVMRTQVRRPEALRDALLCLAAQSDGRFELLLVVHDADLADADAVLAEQPVWLRHRTRLLTASGGTRARPLNAGIDAARGSHVAVLDDDDVVTPRWVATFLDAAASHPRRLLRAVVGVQRVSRVEWPDGIAGHASEPSVTTPYPEKFDLADHLRVNMTPFMAVAFPRAALELLGGADESLEVCEDWDLVLRTAALLGVVDLPGLTAVYRRWTSGDDSYSLHDHTVWQRDMRAVLAKLDDVPLLLPPGSASELAAMSQLRADPSELAEVYGSTSWRLTAPLRALSRAAKRVRHRTVEGRDLVR